MGNDRNCGRVYRRMYIHGTTHTYPHDRAPTDFDASPDGYDSSDSYSYCDSDRDSDTHTHQLADANSYRQPHQYGDRNSYKYAYRNLYTDTNGDIHPNADQHSNTDSDSNFDPY